MRKNFKCFRCDRFVEQRWTNFTRLTVILFSLSHMQMEVKLSDEKDLLHQDKKQICQDLKKFLQPVREKLLQFEQELKDR